MNLIIMNDKFESLFLMDTFESLIWTERYNEAGDFEIYTPYSPDLSEVISVINKNLTDVIDTYIWFEKSSVVMIIETLEFTSELTSGLHVKISGRSLESLLDRRIVWKQTTLNGKVDAKIKLLLYQNMISPENSDRKMNNFIYMETTDENITALTIRKQITGDNLYDVLNEICQLYSLGFRITLNGQNQFVFELYIGTDRSYDQMRNSHVEFSSTFENLYGSNFLKSTKTLKNVTLVAGEDEGNERRTITIGDASGFARRELYTDARDLQSEDENGEAIPDEEYYGNLTARGEEKLSEYESTKAIEAQIDTTSENYRYGIDYFMGDLVQVVTEYGIEAKARITELVRSYDLNGYTEYPTFTLID